MKPSKLKILMVDDDPDYLFQQKTSLEDQGMSVIQASSLKEARSIIENEVFDLAILDLMMEEKDAGLVLSYEIKKREKKLPVILITAVSSQTGMSFQNADEKEKKWIYADLVLQKPVREDQLLSEIDRLMVSHHGEK